MRVINVSSGTDGGQSHYENVMSTAFLFSWGLSGAAQGQTRGSFIRKKCDCIYFSLTAMGKLGGSRGLSGVLGGSRGSPDAYRGQFYWEKVMSTAFIFL